MTRKESYGISTPSPPTRAEWIEMLNAIYPIRIGCVSAHTGGVD